MQTKYAKVKLQLNHGSSVNQEVLKCIIGHLEHDKIFSLCPGDYSDAFVFFPADLTVRHTEGEEFKYDNAEDFSDAISQTLHSYKTFVSETRPKKSSLIIKP